MILIVDANELFAGIITKGKGFQSWTLDILFSDKVEFYAPLRLLVELEKNKEEIMAKSRFSDKDFDIFVGIIKLRINFITLDDFSDKIAEARGLAPHLKDVEYFALALKLDCAIWSEEKAFKKQSEVKVFNSRELVELLIKDN